jgi:Rrf2 family protein
MLDLAVNNNGTYIPLKDIAVRQEISDKYLEQIITQLNKAGYVKSMRGMQGGYMLAFEPNKYTVGMILRLMEGSLSPVPCLEEGNNECNKSDDCVTVEVWKKLKDAIDNVVDNITLEDLVNKYHEKGTYEYFI